MLHLDAPITSLTLSVQGQWSCDAGPITHAKLSAFLHRCIRRSDDGSLIVTTGFDRLPLIVEDAPFLLLGIHTNGQFLVSDQSIEEIKTHTPIYHSPDGKLHVRIKDNQYWALVGKTTAQILWQDFDEERFGFVCGSFFYPLIDEPQTREHWRD